MSGTVAILNRELVARRDLLLVAAAASGIALLMPYMPGLEGYSAPDIRSVSSNILALVIGWALAIGLGATVFGSDLSQGRLGFFFARPVRGLTVWFGRIGAVLALVYVCELVILLPSLIEGWADIFSFWWSGGWEAVIVFVAAPLILVCLSHAVSIMFRARTAWLFLDLAGLVAVGVAAWLSIRPFVFLYPAKDAFLAVGGILVGAVSIGLAAAGAVGVVIGRTDLRRTHGALSLTLWSLLALMVGGTTAYATWLRSFEPADLGRVNVLSVDPTGIWTEVEGSAPGHLDVQRRFLVSTVDTRWLDLPMGLQWFYDGLSFSENGLRAVWLGPGFGEDPRPVQYADLGGSRPEVITTTVVVAPAARLEISPDGRLLAMVEQQTLSVYEFADERLVSAVRLPNDLAKSTIFFLAPETIRLYAKGGAEGSWSIRIAEISVASGELTRLGEVEGIEGHFWASFDALLERMVVGARMDTVGEQATTRRVYDAASGEFLQELDQVFPHFLADGRILVLGKTQDNTLRIREVAPIERVIVNPDVQMSETSHFGGEMLPGQIAFSRETGFDGQKRLMRTDLVDVDSAAVRPIGDDLRLATRGFRWKGGDLGAVFWYVTGFEGARLLERSDGAIVRWDPDSGELFHVVGGSK